MDGLPAGVATDGAGNVYVTEAFSFRIQKFDSAGTSCVPGAGTSRAPGRATPAGREICVPANGDTCKVGAAVAWAARSIAGDIAADGAGNVYVSDTPNRRVEKFDSAGNFVRAWGKDVELGRTATGSEICTARTRTPARPAMPEGWAARWAVRSAWPPTCRQRLRLRPPQQADSEVRLRWELPAGPGARTSIAGDTAPASRSAPRPADTCQAGAGGDMGGEMTGPPASPLTR